MKKLPVWLMVVWFVLGALGVMLLLFGLLWQIQSIVLWLGMVLCWLVLAVWIGLIVVRRMARTSRPRKQFAGNQVLFSRILAETEQAVARYQETVLRKGLLQKQALYERPWFLLCGPEQSGKTSLMRGSGLSFPLQYPAGDRDGIVDARGVTWRFGNEAVWIDTPGIYMKESGADEWAALIAALQRVRSEKPLDGMALVVNAHEILTATDQQLKTMAAAFRSRIDQLIATWGIEFPVYLVFNRTDEIPGFAEYFGDQLERAREQIFGATLSDTASQGLARQSFIQEYELLGKSLTDLRLDKLFKEHDPSRKRQICRFVIHFEGVQEKLAAFVGELFKPSNYEGRPIFRGFYFTSCQKQSGKEPAVTAQQSSSNFSNTIVNHPLNPNRGLAAPMAQPSAGANLQSVKDQIVSYFVLPLFSSIMVKDKALTKTTQKRSRAETLRFYLLSALITGVLMGVLVFAVNAFTNASRLHKTISADLTSAGAATGDPVADYRALGVAAGHLTTIQRYQDYGAPIEIGFGFYRGKGLVGALKPLFTDRYTSLVLKPALSYFEYEIDAVTQEYGQLSGEQYNRLYRALKAYLSICETGATHRAELDTVFLREALRSAAGQSYLTMAGATHLPQQVETILLNSTGLYLRYVKRGEIGLLQANQRLVENARSRLSVLPDGATLYAAVIAQLREQAPQLTLDQLLNRRDSGILRSDRTMSTLFTQAGWEQTVSNAVSQASKNPYTVDWVLGTAASQAPDIDKEKLHDDMVAAYFGEAQKEWYAFLAAVAIEPFGDCARSARMVQKLASDGSELQVLLEAVAAYTEFKKDNLADKAAGKALSAVSKMKGVKKLQKMSGASIDTSVGAGLPFGNQSPADEFNATFERLRAFTRSSGGALSGFQGYKDKLLSLATKLESVAQQGEESAVTIFNGSDADPLLSAWNYSENSVAGMNDELAAALRIPLQLALKQTGTAVSATLSRTLNTRWQNEIVKPYTNRLASRYPFTQRGDDASYTDAMDFFRPNTGTFWGFYERVLAPFVVKQSSGWMVRTLGSVSLSFNPQLAQSLSSAERIRDIFFKPDGTARPLSITFMPLPSNTKPAQLILDGQTYDLPRTSKGVSFSWPVESADKGAVLKIQISTDYSQDITAAGQWSLLKLTQNATVEKVNSSTVVATWQVNVQNMYVIQQKYRLVVSGNDHPFGEALFQKFSIPVDLMQSEK